MPAIYGPRGVKVTSWATLTAARGRRRVVFVVGCSVPLDALELQRVAERCFVGLSRIGSVMDHGSGHFAIAFATRRAAREGSLRPDDYDALFRATADATETTIYNLLVAAEPRSYGPTRIDALPVAPVSRMLHEFGTLRLAPR